MVTSKKKGKKGAGKGKSADVVKRPAPRDLGTATGVAEARQRTPKNPPAQDREDLADVFKDTAEKDALEAKLGEAGKEVKRCHQYSQECFRRLACARLATSEPDAIKHDLERAVQLSVAINNTATEALRLLGR